VLVSIIFIVGGLIIVWRAAPPNANTRHAQPQEPQEQQEEAAVVPQQPGPARMRRRRNDDDEVRAVAPDQPAVEPAREVDVDEDDEDEDEEEEEKENVPGAKPKASLDGKKIGAKKLRKLQEKEERAKIREAAEAERKARREKEDKEILERKQKQQDEAERQQEEEEELERLREERKKKEQEEYDALKGQFEVEEEGSVTNDKQSFHESSDQLIEMVKKEKVVVLEDLAAHFHVSPQDVVDKLTQLEQESRITGIVDERGKFIYVSPQEMANIAKFINNRGRISISEIAHESNKLVHLSS